MQFSVIIPVFNEQDSLNELSDRIEAAFRSMGKESEFEILFIDDGSTDGSREEMRRLAEKRPNVRCIFLRQNTGKALALMAGFLHVESDFVITMDADLQDDPEDFSILIEKIQSTGCDLVTGWRQARQDQYLRKIGSRLFNYIVSKFSGLKLHDINCGLKIFRGKLVKNLCVYGQHHRYIPLQAHLLGYKVTECSVRNNNRKYGESKYRTFRYNSAFDLFTILFTFRYDLSPMHLFGLVSAIFVIPSFLVLTFFLGQHMLFLIGLGEQFMVPLRPLLILMAILFLLGINIFLTGFVCDFILYHKVRQNIDRITQMNLDEIIGKKEDS